jgi:hypothetical protein
MTVDNLHCELSSTPDNIPNWWPNYKSAGDSTISSSFTMAYPELDVGRIAYELLGTLYSRFGFTRDEMPYVQDREEGKRVTSQSIMPNKSQ